MNYIIGGTLATVAGTHIIHNLVVGTLQTIYSSVLFVKNGNEPDLMIKKIKKEIEKLDIKVKLDLVNTLIIKVPSNDINKIIENGLTTLIFNIKTLIELIDYEIMKHNNKWFASYRTVNFDEHLDTLKNYISILDGRINLLINNNNTNINNNNNNICC